MPNCEAAFDEVTEAPLGVSPGKHPGNESKRSFISSSHPGGSISSVAAPHVVAE